MYKTLVKNTLLVIMVLALVLTGCGKTISITDKEDIPEEAVGEKSESMENADDEDSDKENQNTVKEDKEDKEDNSLMSGLFGKEDDPEDYKEVKWDNKIPSIFPESKDGKLVVCQLIEEDNDSAWVLYYVEITEKEIEKYIEDVEDDGWEEVSKMDMGDVSTTTFLKEEYSITITKGIDEDGTVMMGLFLIEESFIEPEADDGDNYDDMDDEDQEYEDSVKYEEQDLPDEFPENEIPLYEEGILILASSMSSDGEVMYILDYMCEEDFDEVTDQMVKRYKKEFDDNVDVIEMGEMTMISGSSSNYDFSVIVIVTDETDYPTSIQISVFGAE